jgi:hypothetical protein
MDRPQKACGPKIYYDEYSKRSVVYGGAYHHSDNGYWEVGSSGDTLVRDDWGQGVNFSRLPWVFDGKAQQWYEMRPLPGTGPPQVNAWWGFYINTVYIPEYALGMIIPANGSFAYAYSAHANCWSHITVSGLPTTGKFLPTAYDRKNRKVVVYSGTSTYIWDMGTRTGQTAGAGPALGYHGTCPEGQWYDAYSCMTYDINSGMVVFIRDDGAETWEFDTGTRQWTRVTTTGEPTNAGSMGEGITYDPDNRICVLFSNLNDEVWTYRHEAVDTNQLGEIRTVDAVTAANSVNLSWEPPVSGPAPDLYLIYRAPWSIQSNSVNPGPYALIDSTQDTAYTDSPQKSSTVYYSYCIVPKKGTESGMMSTPAFSRRPVPMGLVVTAFSRTRVGLKWVADTAKDVAGYNVYRKYGAMPRSRAELTKINGSLVGPRPVYMDNTVSISGNQIVNYAVTTVNRFGQESGFSPRADTRVMRVMGFWADTLTQTLHWFPALADTFATYEVWRQPVGEWEVYKDYFKLAYGSVPDTFKAGVDTAWHYKVRVTNALGQLGYFSDLLPYGSIHNDVRGMFRGDGMLSQPTYDPFWDRLGLTPDEVKIGRLPGLSGTGKAGLLLSVKPNPFIPAVTLSYCVLRASYGDKTPVSLAIYDLTGKKLAQFTQYAERGTPYEQIWNVPDRPSAVYVAVLKAAGKTVRKKLTLLK